MGRLRTNTRGKRIYWRSPSMYWDNLGSTLERLSLGPNPNQELQQFPLYPGRSPLYVQGFWASSNEAAVGDYRIDLYINTVQVYQTDNFSGLSSDRSFNVKIRDSSVGKIRLHKNDQYEIRMIDDNNVSNEVNVFMYGYYYIFDDKILYSSPQMFSFNNPSTYETCFIWRNEAIGQNLLCEDYNQIYITHMAFSMSGAESSRFQAQVFNRLEDGTQITTSLTDEILTTDTEEHIIPLRDPFWLKPGHYYGWQTRDGNNNGTQDPTCRLIGYRRQQEGKYSFSGYSNFWDTALGVNSTQVTAFTIYTGEDYGSYWPLVRTIGIYGCGNDGLVISRNELFLNTITQASDITDLTNLDIRDDTEKSATWTRNPANGWSSYMEFPDRYGMEAGVSSGTSGGDYFTRHIMQVVL